MPSITQHFKDFGKNFAPKLDSPAEAAEAIAQGIGGITWTNHSRRIPSIPQSHPSDLERTETSQTHRVVTPPPSIPERNPARGNYILKIRQHQNEEESKKQGRPASLNTAQVNRFLRDTRPGFSQYRPQDHPILQEGPGRRRFPVVQQRLNHPQINHGLSTMAGTRRTVFLDATRASTQSITPHQIFLQSQVKRQQDATNAWAHRTGKPAPPYHFEDFIGKGAYGRVFKA